MHPTFAFIEGIFSGPHLLILLIIGLLVFGKRLPEVGRSLGKGIVEFKKGLKGLEDDFDANASAPQETRVKVEPPRPPQRIAAAAPKFEDQGEPTSPPPQA
jgi:sec-independent protein translocase protein TatA